LAQRDLGKTMLSLISIAEFPGKENFRGLGELDAQQLASLFPGRLRITSKQLQLARSAWQAYCSANPTDIERALERDTSPLPFLERAVRAHLKRFPSTKNGLGRIENSGLELINGGSKNFIDLFSRFGDVEPIYGLGDAQFWLALRRMSDARHPLLTIEEGQNGGPVLSPDIVRKARFEITEPGKAMLKGEADFVVLNVIDLWLGGVHLSPNNLWRWYESSETLVSD
jgi:hypothetical protein